MLSFFLFDLSLLSSHLQSSITPLIFNSRIWSSINLKFAPFWGNRSHQYLIHKSFLTHPRNLRNLRNSSRLCALFLVLVNSICLKRTLNPKSDFLHLVKIVYAIFFFPQHPPKMHDLQLYSKLAPIVSNLARCLTLKTN